MNFESQVQRRRHAGSMRARKVTAEESNSEIIFQSVYYTAIMILFLEPCRCVRSERLRLCAWFYCILTEYFFWMSMLELVLVSHHSKLRLHIRFQFLSQIGRRTFEMWLGNRSGSSCISMHRFSEEWTTHWPFERQYLLLDRRHSVAAWYRFYSLCSSPQFFMLINYDDGCMRRLQHWNFWRSLGTVETWILLCYRYDLYYMPCHTAQHNAALLLFSFCFLLSLHSIVSWKKNAIKNICFI